MKRKLQTVQIFIFPLALILAPACPSQAQSTNTEGTFELLTKPGLATPTPAQPINTITTPGKSTNSQPSAADFQQAVADYQRTEAFADADKVIQLATAMPQLPPIPEEARKHFVMGHTIFEEAKNTNDFAQAASEFKEAIKQAPWLTNAWLYIGLVREAAGDYDKALNDLKRCQMFKLSDDEARKVQDEIYKIEAKQKMAAKEAQAVAQKQAEDARAKAEADAAAARQMQIEDAKRNSFEGTWADSGGYQKIIISRNTSGSYTVSEYISRSSYQDRNIRVNGRNIRFIRDGEGVQLDFDLTLSDNGEKLVGSYDFLGTANGPSWKRGDSWRSTSVYEFHRQ
jgi:hypothetical protein